MDYSIYMQHVFFVLHLHGIFLLVQRIFLMVNPMVNIKKKNQNPGNKLHQSPLPFPCSIFSSLIMNMHHPACYRIFHGIAGGKVTNLFHF